MKQDKLHTATVTWIYYENYGTFLQAYALQQVLYDLGVDNRIIDDKKILFPHAVRNFFSAFKRFFFGKVNPNSTYFKEFKKEYLIIDRNYTKPEDLNKRYDAFICGSDQIWSPYINPEFRPYYYLSFTDKKKIAYAPSTGTGTSNPIYRQTVKPWLERFHSLSVREESGAKMLSSFVEKDIQTVLDPTLLLTGTSWRKLILPHKHLDSYVLCYFLTPNSWYMEYVKAYARKQGKKIKVFFTHEQFRTYGDTCIYGGPQEFLTFIDQADKVFTDSFHASIFSILFQKDFITFKRFEDGKGNDQNARIADLFQKLGLFSRFIGCNDLTQIETLPQINHTDVQKRLDVLRSKSLLFLKKALYDGKDL